ncbi:MAG: flagellar motor switch protein FliM [Gammaproteobacteria bacterium]|nr:flagellar motor switch protein FliM [Gammaproteobacteria bacterium]
MNENLSQDEIDTLLGGVDSGAVETEVDRLADSNEAVLFDFTSQSNLIRGRMPALDTVNENFTRSLQTSVFNMLRRTAHVTVEGVKMLKYSDYLKGLTMPTSCNVVNIKPLQGNGMIVIDPKLVFATVDNFFGGDGRYQSSIEGREFTPTEKRVVQILLDLSFADLKKAWEPVIKLDFSFINSEINPAFAKIVDPTDVVVVSTFNMDLEGGAGEFHIVMPYVMVEPIMDLLETGASADENELNQNWVHAMEQEVKQAVIELSCSMAHTKLTLGEVLDFTPGDIIPIGLSELVTVRAAGTPVFKGLLGVSSGKNAVRYVEPIRRTDYPQ